MGKLKIQKNVEMELEFAPCIKCGGHDITFGDCNYSSFNIAYGHCNNWNCGHKADFNCGCFPDKEWIVGEWNKVNDIPTILVDKRLKMTTLLKEIHDLEHLHQSRQ